MTKPVWVRTTLTLSGLCMLVLSFPALAADGLGYHRLDGHIDSWLALAIVVVSVLVAVALNHAAPAIRTAGTVLAACGCLSVTLWFGWAYSTGIVSNPKPPVVPPNALNPMLLWIIAATSLVAGFFLLRVAAWQSRRTDRLELPAKNDEVKFGLVSRYLHWITAILFLSLLPMGLFTSIIPEDVVWRQGYYVVHKTIGFLVLMLVIARLAWHLKTSITGLDSSLKTWERRSAKTAHYLLYFLMLALPISGYIMSTLANKLSHFFIWDTPVLFGPDMELVKLWGLIHKVILPYLCFLVIGAHVIGALKHQFVDKHRESFRRMVS